MVLQSATVHSTKLEQRASVDDGNPASPNIPYTIIIPEVFVLKVSVLMNGRIWYAHVHSFPA